MNVLPEVALHSPDEPVSVQVNNSPTEVELVKPSVLTFPESPENTNDREERSSPQSVLDSVVGDSISPRHKTRNQGIELKIRYFHIWYVLEPEW